MRIPCRHQLLGVRQNIAVVVRAVPVKLRPGFVIFNDGSAGAAGFRRQFWPGEGIGNTIQLGGFTVRHMAVHLRLRAVRAGQGGEDNIDAIVEHRIVPRPDGKGGSDSRPVGLGDGHGCGTVRARFAVIFRGGGGQLSVANMYRVGVIHLFLAVERIFAGDNKITVREDVA